MHIFLLKKVPRIKANSIPSLVDLQQRAGDGPSSGCRSKGLAQPEFQQPPSPNIVGKDGRHIIFFLSGERIF